MASVSLFFENVEKLLEVCIRLKTRLHDQKTNIIDNLLSKNPLEYI
jgi:hypothetical protein